MMHVTSAQNGRWGSVRGYCRVLDHITLGTRHLLGPCLGIIQRWLSLSSITLQHLCSCVQQMWQSRNHKSVQTRRSRGHGSGKAAEPPRYIVCPLRCTSCATVLLGRATARTGWTLDYPCPPICRFLCRCLSLISVLNLDPSLDAPTILTTPRSR
jgi:hypothetical protein